MHILPLSKKPENFGDRMNAERSLTLRKTIHLTINSERTIA